MDGREEKGEWGLIRGVLGKLKEKIMDLLSESRLRVPVSEQANESKRQYGVLHEMIESLCLQPAALLLGQMLCSRSTCSW